MNKIICGSAKPVLETLPSESVNCIVTSPPYWGLRDYGIEPTIWDGVEGCEHEWGDKRKIPKTTQWNTGGVFDPNNRKTVQEEKYIGQFCLKCNAWRGSLGLEPTFELYIKHLCDIFDEGKRVLRKDGTCFVNIGDSYGGSGNASGHTEDTKNLGYKTSEMGATKGNQKATRQYAKSLLLIPQRFAIEMVNRGWILRNTIIWHKPNCMPSSAKDRFTNDFEYIYFFSKSKKYYFEQQLEPHKEVSIKARNSKLNQTTNIGASRSAVNVQMGNESRGNRFIPEGGRNKRAVWTISTKPFPLAHFAVFPEALIETPIKAGCPKGGVVLDPFCGSGTSAVVAKKQGKRYIGIELKQEYIDMANKRIRKIPETLF